MSTLILTEKSSQVKALGKIIPLKRNKRDSIGRYNGEDFILFPLSGHIMEPVSLTNFSDTLDELPNLPSEDSFMKLVKIAPSEWEKGDSKASKLSKGKVYDALNSLLKKNYNNIHKVIIATDPDFEGCAIAKEIVDEFALDNKQINFMNISNIVPSKLKKELDAAISGIDALDWEKWANVSFIKREINNCTGIDASHFLTLTSGTKTTFGSQQTRLLKLIVDRYFENKEFDSSLLYRIRVKTTHGDFLVEMDKEEEKDRNYAKSVLSDINSRDKFPISNIAIKKTKGTSPKWYDGSDMGVEISTTLGKNIEEIIGKGNGLLQTMYEAEKITYPRGDAGGKMPISQLKEQQSIALSLQEFYGADRLDVEILKPYLWRNDIEDDRLPINNKIINHTPCTVASHELDMSALTDSEKAVIDMSAKMLLAAFYPENKFIGYTVQGECEGFTLTHKSVEDIDMGWKELYGKKERISPFPSDGMDGDIVNIEDIILEEYSKDPPPLFTQSSLLKEAKKKKIGAESTFSNHVKTMLDPKRAYTFKKGNSIVPTEKAIALIELIPIDVINLLSLFDKLVVEGFLDGNNSLEDVLRGRRKIIENVYNEITKACKEYPDKLEKLIEGSRQAEEAKKIIIGKCPLCSKNVVDMGGNSYTYSCEGKRNVKENGEWKNKGCPIVIFKKIENKGIRYLISPKVAKELLEGETPSVKIYWKDKDTTTDIRLIFDTDCENPMVDTKRKDSK